MKMPFGKHKGIELTEIIEEYPDYIVWLAENTTLRGELKEIVNEVYDECKIMVRNEREIMDYPDEVDDWQRGFTWWDWDD